MVGGNPTITDRFYIGILVFEYSIVIRGDQS